MPMVRRRMSNQWGSQPHPICSAKTLTASDTSSHGGFSVPRHAAEDCFPPLPQRHLLTTGWSAFVNKKKLVSGFRRCSAVS
ncbi:hypothetical protein ACE6H2_026257 [Prunus campanulata]